MLHGLLRLIVFRIHRGVNCTEKVKISPRADTSTCMCDGKLVSKSNEVSVGYQLFSVSTQRCLSELRPEQP